MAKTMKQVMARILQVTKKNTVALHKQFSIDMLTAFAMDTPVDEGFATGNWILQPNFPNLKPTRISDRSNSASKATENAESDAISVVYGDVIYVSNAVQGRNDQGSFNGEGYIIGLEHGKSQQAPAGMFLKNIAKANIIVKGSMGKVFG